MTDQAWPINAIPVAVIERDGDERIVAVRGEVDAYSAPQLREALAELARSGQGRIVVDVKDMGFIDSDGLGVLIATARQLRQEHRALALRKPNRQTAKLLEITGLRALVAVD